MENKQSAARPLDLEGAFNVRDLGTYTDRQGRKLMEHRLLRADGMQNLTDRDLETLKAYGLIGSVDLRTVEECERRPSRLRNVPGLFYEQVPIQDGIHGSRFAGGFPPSLGALYTDILINSGEQLARVWRLLGRCREGCVLFHCAAGKDRTGVVSMLALSAAGVDRETVLTDYAASEEYMREPFARQRQELAQAGLTVYEYLFASDRTEMEQALKYIETMFGTTEAYLRSIGLTSEEIRRVTAALGAGTLEETA